MSDPGREQHDKQPKLRRRCYDTTAGGNQDNLAARPLDLRASLESARYQGELEGGAGFTRTLVTPGGGLSLPNLHPVTSPCTGFSFLFVIWMIRHDGSETIPDNQ